MITIKQKEHGWCNTNGEQKHTSPEIPNPTITKQVNIQIRRKTIKN
jgi:hypothetical protein